MEGRKLWVVALLSCLFLAGASIAVFRTVSANKTAGAPASGVVRQQSPQVTMTLHVSGSYPQLKFKDSPDLQESPASSSDNARPVKMVAADLNGDGFPDMVALYAAPDHSEVRVRLNTSDDILLDPTTTQISEQSPTAIVAGDFNVDGYKDLAIANRDGSISLLYGDGRGNFSAGPVIQSGGSISAMAAADVDRDGLVDLLVLDQASATLKIYIGQGDLSKAKPSSINLSKLGNLTAVTTADFSVHHAIDIAVAGDRGVAVLRGDGTGHFSKPQIIGSVGPVTGMVARDLTGDQVPDIAVSNDSSVTVFKSHRDGHFSAGRSYAAGSGVTDLIAGTFDSDGFTDLAVADGTDQISVLLNKKGHGFSDPLSMTVDGGAAALLTGFNKRVGIDSIAAARKSGGITVAAASGGTITVTTVDDENDCPSCDVAGLEAFKDGTAMCAAGVDCPGGQMGIGLREAITAINNDSVLHGSSNWTISFAGVGRAQSAIHDSNVPFICQHLHQGTSWLFIIGAVLGTTMDNGLGPLPPIDAPGTTIDGNLVDHTSNGVNNPDGPQVIIRGNDITKLIVLTSNATNSTLKNLNLVNSQGDAIVVQGAGNTISANVIGLDCDSSSTQGPLNDGNQNAGINFQSGSVNETITNNIIGNNGFGIIMNGVSQATSVPQNNEISGNIIGLGKDLRHLDLPALTMAVCPSCVSPPYVQAPRGNTNDGILLQNGAVGNTIENNTISNNGASNPGTAGGTGPGHGIEIQGDITSDAIIMNNKIGTDPAGVSIVDSEAPPAPIGNLGDGIFIGSVGNPKFNQVSNNVISGNGGPIPSMDVAQKSPRTDAVRKSARIKPAIAPITGGIAIGAGDFNAQFNTVTNNKIGTNVNGSVQLPNTNFGVLLEFTANNNTIGGASAADGNVISGNGVGIFGPGVLIVNSADNNLIQNNFIGPNALGTGAPTDLINPSNPVSNKGGGMVILENAFANRIITNKIAFNNSGATASGITCTTTFSTLLGSGSFNTFSQNQIYLNPPNTSPTLPAILEATPGGTPAGLAQEHLANSEILPPPPPVTTLLKIDSGVTVTDTGDTTISGTADFIDRGVTAANINTAKVEIFVSQRGSTTDETLSEAQAFLATVTSFQVDPHVTGPGAGNVVDWSAHLTIPAPFLQPVQTPILFLTATITTGDGSTSPLSLGFVPQFVSSGGGGGCVLTPNPTVVSFNNAPVGTATSHNLVITNTGSTVITVSSVSLAQTGSLFSLGALTLPATLNPTDTLTIAVSFTPTDTSPHSATVNVVNNCTNLAVPVSGTGSSTTIQVIPTSLDFGMVSIGDTETKAVTIINFGSGTLNITSLQIPNSATTQFSVVANPAPFSISGLSSATVNVKFAPTGSGGTRTDSLIVASNDVIHPSITVSLTGTAQNATPPTVIVNQPTAGQVVGAGASFTVGFAAIPGGSGITLVSYVAKLSLDGGSTFPTTLTSGTPNASGITTFTALAPSTSTASAVVQVTVTDSSSLTGTGTSSAFTIGTPPTITSVKIKPNGKVKLHGNGIQSGAVFVIGSETWALTSRGGDFYLVTTATIGSLNHHVSDVVTSGQTYTVFVRNPGGLTSPGFSTQAF